MGISTKTAEQRFWAKVDTSGECWVWTACKLPRGYGQFFHEGGKVYAHRFIWTVMHGDIPDDLEICHRCDNPSCVRPDHLFLGTRTDNMRDCVTKGRFRFHPFPKGHPYMVKVRPSKLTEVDVRAIRLQYKQGETITELARSFGVTRSCVGFIVRRQTWKHILE
jgi:hypothetical protein